MNTHVWSSGFLKGIISYGLSAMFLTKSRRLALPLEELTYAYVATPAYEQSALRRPPSRHKARGRLVPTNVGISDVPRGHRTARTAGRDDLLLPCSQSGALRNLCPACLQDRTCDNPHGTGNLEKKFWQGVCIGLPNSLLPFSRFTGYPKDNQSSNLPASSFFSLLPSALRSMHSSPPVPDIS